MIMISELWGPMFPLLLRRALVTYHMLPLTLVTRVALVSCLALALIPMALTMRSFSSSSNKNDVMIRKEVNVSPAVVLELKRIIEDSEITKEDDRQWPEADHVGRQELEIKIGNEHISFTTTKIGSLLDLQESKDPEGMRAFYYLVQDLKCFVFSLIKLHFKIKPIP